MIVVVPVPVVEAVPVLLMIATLMSDELQVTCEPRFSVDPSLKVPCAEKDCRLPNPILGFAGVIFIELKVALVTVKAAVPACPANVAVIVALPDAFPVIKPNDPEATLAVATVGSDVVHATEFVMSCIVPSVSVPFAVSPIDVPAATEGVDGVTVMAVNPSTVRLAAPLTPFSVQVMVTGPLATPVTMFALTVALLVSDDVHEPTVSMC